MNHGSSIWFRAVLALALCVGFYALALAVSGGCFWLSWYFSTSVRSLRGGIICGVCGLAVLYAVIPRRLRIRVVDSGVLLDPERHPRLRLLVEDVAARTGQRMPDSVRLVNGMNAGVYATGGFAGIGSRRVLLVGLPLLQILTHDQIRAVLAHEFGHFRAGDTWLGPLVHRMGLSIGQTILALRKTELVLLYVFKLYGHLYLRVSQAVSRRQELAADALSAEIVGPEASATALKKSHWGGPAYTAYFMSEFAPALAAGYRPPLGEGFARFVKSPEVRATTRTTLEASLRQMEQDPFDTHPPLARRLEALAARRGRSPSPAASAPAISLLDDVDALEVSLLAEMVHGVRPEDLVPLRWSECAAHVWIPSWERVALAVAPRLRGVAVEHLPEFFRNPVSAHRALAGRGAGRDRDGIGLRNLFGAVLMTILSRRGHVIRADVGSVPVAVVNGTEVRPFGLIEELRSGAQAPSEWEADSASLGLDGVDIGRELLGEPAVGIAPGAAVPTPLPPPPKRRALRPQAVPSLRKMNLAGSARRPWLRPVIGSGAFLAVVAVVVFLPDPVGDEEPRAQHSPAGFEDLPAEFEALWRRPGIDHFAPAFFPPSQVRVWPYLRKTLVEHGWEQDRPALTRRDSGPDRDYFHATYTLRDATLTVEWRHRSGRWWLNAFVVKP